MSQNSKPTEHCTNDSTETKRTDGTSAATHLARLSEHARWLDTEGASQRFREITHKGRIPTIADVGFKMGEWATSVRWAIWRERERQAIEELSG